MFDPGFKNSIQSAFGHVADALREPDKVCFLLRRNPHSAGWKTVRQMRSGYSISYVKDSFRKMISFVAFTSDKTFLDDFAQATHIGWGVPDHNNEITLYEMDTEQKDETDAGGLSPAWRTIGVKIGNQRFEIP